MSWSSSCNSFGISLSLQSSGSGPDFRTPSPLSYQSLFERARHKLLWFAARKNSGRYRQSTSHDADLTAERATHHPREIVCDQIALRSVRNRLTSKPPRLIRVSRISAGATTRFAFSASYLEPRRLYLISFRLATG